MGTNVYLKSKIEERTSQAAVLANMQATAAENSRDLTDEERKTFDAITKRLNFLDDEIKRITAAEEGAAKFVEIYGAHRERQERAAAAADRRRAAEYERPPEERARKSWGQRFVESDQFKSFGGHGTSQPFQIDDEGWIEERADITTGMFADADGIPRPSQLVRPPTPPAFDTPLFNVIGREPTSMSSVEYYYWHFGDAESLASEVPEGDLKPEAEIEGELVATPMTTYAWWKGITRQALDDLPNVRSIVEGYLRRGVMRRIERAATDALTGNTDVTAVNQPLLAGIRVGMATVQDQGYTPNAVLLSPFDFAELDIALLGATLNGPVVGTNFWGIVPVPSSGITPGNAYVGDLREAVTFYDRNQVNVIMTDSHADYFLRNKLVILAEARGKVVVTNAAAVVHVVGSASTPPGGGEGGEGGETRRARTATPPTKATARA